MCIRDRPCLAARPACRTPVFVFERGPSREQSGSDPTALLRAECRKRGYERRHGVSAERSRVLYIKSPLPLCALCIRSYDEGIRIHKMERSDQHPCGEQRAECKTLPFPAQNGCREPEEDNGQPAHEGRRVQPQFCKSILALVEPHPLER